MKLSWVGLFLLVLLSSQIFAESPKYSDEYILNLVDQDRSLNNLDHKKYHGGIGFRCPHDQEDFAFKQSLIEEGYKLNLYSIKARDELLKRKYYPIIVIRKNNEFHIDILCSYN